MLDATTAGQIGDHRRGQQLAVLHHVDPAVGETAFVAQPHHVELEVFSGSPPAMKCAEIVLGGSFSDTVRLPATKDCAIIWPPNVRTGFLLGMRADEGVVGYLLEVEYRQQFVEVCS